MEIIQPGLRRQPFRQRFDMQQLLGGARIFPLLVRNDDQRMLAGLDCAAIHQQLICGLFGHQFVGYQVGNQLCQCERTVALMWCGQRDICVG